MTTPAVYTCQHELEPINHKTKKKVSTINMKVNAGWYCVLIGESNVAIDPAIGGYGVADIYLREFLPHLVSW